MRVTRGLVALGALAAVATSAWLVRPYGHTTWGGRAPSWLAAEVVAAVLLVAAATVLPGAGGGTVR